MPTGVPRLPAGVARRALTVERAPSRVDAWLLTDLVTRLRRVLRASIRSDFPWETLPMAQVELLQRLAEEPGLRVSELARRHRLATNTVSNLVQQMVVSGLVVRDTDEGDRRAVTVALTDLGANAISAWRSAHEQRLDAALSALTTRERTAIAAALPALTRLVGELEWDESGEDAAPGEAPGPGTRGSA